MTTPGEGSILYLAGHFEGAFVQQIINDTVLSWIEKAIQDGATHLVLLRDRGSHEEHPIPVMAGQNPREVAEACDDAQDLDVVSVLHLPEDRGVMEPVFHY